MADLIASVSGALVSLLLNLVPGLRVKWAALSSEVKSICIVGLMVLASVGIYLAGCYEFVKIEKLVCGDEGIKDMLRYFVIALVTSQGVYTLTPQPGDVVETKLAR